MAERALATAFVNIVPGTKDIEAYLKTGLGADAVPAGEIAGTQLGQAMGSKFLTSFKTIAATLGIGLGITAVTQWVRASSQAYADEQAGQAQTAAAIKSTGGAAQVTAGHVETLAQKLEGLTATDADQIRTGENLLLTFTNIQNRVGDGNDIFDQATKAAVDMARAMGTDVSSSAMQLGKALQDPEKGVAALQRVGVRLSDQQKQQVADFMKVGDVASAQKVIIGELNKEFGGSGAAYAGTYAGAMFRVNDAFDDMGKKVIGELAPGLIAFAGVVTDQIVPGLEAIGSFFVTYGAPIGAFVATVGLLTLALNAQAIATAISTSAWWANTAALLANPMTWIVLAIAAVVAGIVYLATQTTFFQDAWTVMTEAVSVAWNATVKFFTDGWNATVAFFNTAWKVIGDIFKAALDFVVNLFLNWTVYGLIIKNWDAISAFFSTTFTNIGKWFKALWDGAVTAWNTFSGWIKLAVGAVGDFFKTTFQGVSDFIGKIFSGLVGILKTPINAIIGMVNTVIGAINSIKIDVPDWVPGIGGTQIGFNIPKIPQLATGGLVTSATLALIGEAGPEVVTPLKDFERMMGSGGKGTTIIYNAAPNDSIDAEQKLVDAVQRARVLGWT